MLSKRNRINDRIKKGSLQQESNPRHPILMTGTLTTKLPRQTPQIPLELNSMSLKNAICVLYCLVTSGPTIKQCLTTQRGNSQQIHDQCSLRLIPTHSAIVVSVAQWFQHISSDQGFVSPFSAQGFFLVVNVFFWHLFSFCLMGCQIRLKLMISLVG